jgi:hypothetical protein
LPTGNNTFLQTKVMTQRKVEMTGALAVRLPASSAAKTRNPLAFNQVNCYPTPSIMYLVKINWSEWRTTRLTASLEARQARRSRSSNLLLRHYKQNSETVFAIPLKKISANL